MQAEKYVTYYRVSTKKQGESGLGLEAQKVTVQAFVSSANGHGSIVAEFTEVETGKKNSRPKLLEAIEYTKKIGGRLIIAKLDRLSRNAGFIFALRDSGVNFVACDLPDANTLTIGIFATIAQHEREIISKRTIEALAAKKRQGYKLGSPANLNKKACENSVKSRRESAKSNQSNVRALAIAKDLREQGLSYNKIAQKLNNYGLKGTRGGSFHAVTIAKLFKLYGEDREGK